MQVSQLVTQPAQLVLLSLDGLAELGDELAQLGHLSPRWRGAYSALVQEGPLPGVLPGIKFWCLGAPRWVTSARVTTLLARRSARSILPPVSRATGTGSCLVRFATCRIDSPELASSKLSA
ncbi:hypothetical protein GCM10010176_103740 [Nonomuraea spiralis]|nr:hypothetical protein GCM10010176_103740 [Nonomuraea spiralis]